MTIGSLPGIERGTQFEDRAKLAAAGVHRALRGGITGNALKGAESIVLSGGYVDDHDSGDEIIYTGHGGRDPATGRQIADQTFIRGNQALVTSCLAGLPVRVIRGAGHRSPFSPQAGYRFDGLYRVDRYWREAGRDGFMICRYRLLSEAAFTKRPLIETAAGEPDGGVPPQRHPQTILRIVRDTALGREVKILHKHLCQVCGQHLQCQGGAYAEAAHIRPLGRPHHGPDELSNLLCLCPNHHVLFDYGAFSIASDMTLLGMNGHLRTHRHHTLNDVHLAYHRRLWGFLVGASIEAAQRPSDRRHRD